MIDVKKDGRRVLAMVMSSPADGVVGIAQCAIPGCEAHVAIIHVPGGDPADQVMEFLENHDCGRRLRVDRRTRTS